MTTIKKDLHYGDSVWTAEKLPRLSYAPLNENLKTDVVIIGAGITGAFMAEELNSAGFDVTVLDRRPPLHGSAMATTALLLYEIDQPLLKLQKQIGFDKAARAWRRSHLALTSLINKTRLLDIKCDLREENSLYLAGDVLGPGELQKEQQIRAQIGLQSRWLDKKQIAERFPAHAKAALESPGNYSANPVHLAAGYFQRSNARIFSPVDVVDIETSAHQVHVHTKPGHIITAKHLVFTTGYEVPDQLAKQNYEIHSTWAIAIKDTALAKNLPMIWEASDPYLYIRATASGHIICGGEDEEFSDEETRNALTQQKTKTLRRKLKKILPGEHVPDFAWCGSFGVTPTGLPLIGAVPRMKNCYAVMAFGGNGIINGRLGAEIIRGLITGKNDPDEDLYKFRN